MELTAQINGAVNSFVWGAPMLILLIGVGILMTVRNKGLQFRKFGYAMKNTIGKIFKRTHAGEGEITPFQAVSTALAGTVGTGNIAGIPTAVTLGAVSYTHLIVWRDTSLPLARGRCSGTDRMLPWWLWV